MPTKIAEAPTPSAQKPYGDENLRPLNRDETLNHLQGCKRLPSLNTINSALRDLLSSEDSSAAEISEIVRKDPSLTARLLRLVNSAYFGLSSSVNSVEEAVFFLGVRQVKQLAMTTPVIEDLQEMIKQTSFDWSEFWKHCIAVAVITREIASRISEPSPDESDYLAGLLHDVGKIATAAVFPDRFVAIQNRVKRGDIDLLEAEKMYLGMDHSEIGATYLAAHNLPTQLVNVCQFNHTPYQATDSKDLIAIVHIANAAIRGAEIGHSGNPNPMEPQAWLESPAWKMLAQSGPRIEIKAIQSEITTIVSRLPSLLDKIV